MALREIPNYEQLTRGKEFLSRIGRPDLEKTITSSSPELYISPEFGLNEIGPVKGRLGYAGGLGILSGDHVLQLAQTGLPAEAIGLLHTKRMKPVLNDGNWQDDVSVPILSPQELGLKKRDMQVAVAANDTVVQLDVFDLPVGGQTTLHLLHENGLGEVYPGQPKDSHRLYQMAVLGFGGWQIMEQTKKIPAKLHLNESSTSLTAVAMWDSTLQRYMDQGMGEDEAFKKSLQFVRSHTNLTNHTLVIAAEAEYSADQYENYVLKNIQSPAIKQKLRDLITFNGGNMRILDLGMFLSGGFNGVSALHSRLATQAFQKKWGEVIDGDTKLEFQDVTNAIDYRWYERVHELYRSAGILDEFDLPSSNYQELIDALPTEALREIKNADRAYLRSFLETATLGNNEPRVDGKPVPLKLPEDAIIVGWARRFADYKRPGMMLEDMDKIKKMIQEHPNVHIVYSGKTHPTDDPMKTQLMDLLNKVQGDEVLSGHVHFVQDYDISVGKALTAGADIWVNNPRVNEEACGTSIFKAVANNALLVSTPDGGAADVNEHSYIAIKGQNHEEELASLYDGLEEAIERIETGGNYWGDKIRGQLKSFMPIIAGGRMISDYLNFQFPKPGTA